MNIGMLLIIIVGGLVGVLSTLYLTFSVSYHLEDLQKDYKGNPFDKIIPPAYHNKNVLGSFYGDICG